LVSVIIVNYNTFKLTSDCIESIPRCTTGVDYEVIVVDNASPNDRPDEFLVRYPFIKLVKSRENLGFAGGNNLGIAHATGDTILLLNSDTYLVENSIESAYRTLCKIDGLGALTVKLIYPGGRLQHTARRFRSIRNELLDLGRPLLMLMPYEKRARLMLNQYFKGDFNVYCDWVSGAFMMFRRSVLDIYPDKKLDERFFMYGEDQLWCYQFLQAGYKNYYLSETKVVHIGSASTAKSKRLSVLKTMIKNELIFARVRRRSILYRWVFSLLFAAKEYARFYILSVIK
jgi:GT2 family glycosyltransferase